jgi:hypothetical protein
MSYLTPNVGRIFLARLNAMAQLATEFARYATDNRRVPMSRQPEHSELLQAGVAFTVLQITDTTVAQAHRRFHRGEFICMIINPARTFVI